MNKNYSEKCKICGRPLFNEKSKQHGMGSKCWAKQKEAEGFVRPHCRTRGAEG